MSQGWRTSPGLISWLGASLMVQPTLTVVCWALERLESGGECVRARAYVCMHTQTHFRHLGGPQKNEVIGPQGGTCWGHQASRSFEGGVVRAVRSTGGEAALGPAIGEWGTPARGQHGLGAWCRLGDRDFTKLCSLYVLPAPPSAPVFLWAAGPLLWACGYRASEWQGTGCLSFKNCPQ